MFWKNIYHFKSSRSELVSTKKLITFFSFSKGSLLLVRCWGHKQLISGLTTLVNELFRAILSWVWNSCPIKLRPISFTILSLSSQPNTFSNTCWENCKQYVSMFNVEHSLASWKSVMFSVEHSLASLGKSVWYIL